MLQLSDVSKQFGEQKMVLNRIHMDLRPGELTVLIGPNGSGKTTLFNIIAGNIQADSGNVYLENNSITHFSELKRSKFISRVFQDPNAGTAGELTVAENFRLAYLRGKPKRLRMGLNPAFYNMVENRVSKLGMGLENKLQQKMSDLSGGQRQALTLLMSVMAETKILLLDEPTAALDVRVAHKILSITQQIIQEYNVIGLLITHQLKDALQFGNRILMLQDGKLEKDVSGIVKQNLTLTDVVQWIS